MFGNPALHSDFAYVGMGPDKEGEDEMIGRERRIYPRAEVNWPVSADTDEGIMRGETKNLSMLGAFITCSKPLGSDEIVALTINIPDTEHSLTVRAQVVWSRACACEDDSGSNGMGVKFIWHWPAIMELPAPPPQLEAIH